jgi:hypothetical protein
MCFAHHTPVAAGEFHNRGEIPQEFLTTHWSIVTLAADTGSPNSLEALEKLCRAYWFPLIRHLFHSLAA